MYPGGGELLAVLRRNGGAGGLLSFSFSLRRGFGEDLKLKLACGGAGGRLVLPIFVLLGPRALGRTGRASLR